MTNKLTAADVSKLSAAELLRAYNELTGQTVVRFSSRAAGERRVLDAIRVANLSDGLANKPVPTMPLKAALEASLAGPSPATLGAAAAKRDDEERDAAKAKLVRFEVGRTYWTRSAVDHDTVHAFKITARTDKQIQTVVDRKTVRRGLSVYAGIEQFRPFGNYSMAAIISADRVDDDETAEPDIDDAPISTNRPETDPVLDAGIAAIVADTASKLHGAGSTVTYAGAAIAAGLTPKQARKAAEKVAGELLAKSSKIEPTAKQAAMFKLLTRPQGAVRKELLAAMNAVAGASPSACLKLAELFGYDFHYTAKTETTPVSYRLTPKKGAK